MELGGPMLQSPIIPILSRTNPIPRKDTYFIGSILILPSNQRLCLPKGLFPVGLPVKILKTPLSSIIATRSVHLKSSRFNPPDYININKYHDLERRSQLE